MEGALRAGARPGRRVRRSARTRGSRRRRSRCARSRLGPLGDGRRRAAARRAREHGRSPGALRVRDRRRRPGRPGGRRARRYGGNRRPRAAGHGGLRLRPDLRPARRGADRRGNSATRGSAATRTAPALRLRSSPPCPRRTRRVLARHVRLGQAGDLLLVAAPVPPIDLGADDHVRHHVDQIRSSADAPRACTAAASFEPDEEQQDLEGHLQQVRPRELRQATSTASGSRSSTARRRAPGRRRRRASREPRREHVRDDRSRSRPRRSAATGHSRRDRAGRSRRSSRP